MESLQGRGGLVRCYVWVQCFMSTATGIGMLVFYTFLLSLYPLEPWPPCVLFPIALSIVFRSFEGRISVQIKGSWFLLFLSYGPPGQVCF